MIMEIEAAHTITDSYTRIVIFLKSNGEPVDADITAIVSFTESGIEQERIFLPLSGHGEPIDPVYPENESRFVSRIEKGIYQVLVKGKVSGASARILARQGTYITEKVLELK